MAMASSFCRAVPLFLLIIIILNSGYGADGFRVELSRSQESLTMHGMQRQEHAHKQHQGNYQTSILPSTQGYLMDISVGSPPQRFKALVDTATDLVWLKFVTDCLTCNDTIFEIGRSKTYKPLACSSPVCRDNIDLQQKRKYCFPNLVSMYLAKQCGTYVIGEDIVGLVYMGTDTISFTRTKRKSNSRTHRYQAFHNVFIGAGWYTEGLDELTHGVVGLGRGPLSLVSQLGQDKFSYCLGDNSSHSSPLLFGDAANLTGEGIQSTPFLPSKDSYTVLLHGVQIGGEFIETTNSTTIIGSATTFTLLESQTYSRVVQVFNSSVELPKANLPTGLLCYNISSNRDYKFPPLSLHFHGATLDAPQANYMFHPVFHTKDPDVSCLGLAPNMQKGNVIGNLMQQNFHVLFDRNASMFSFVPAECDRI